MTAILVVIGAIILLVLLTRARRRSDARPLETAKRPVSQDSQRPHSVSEKSSAQSSRSHSKSPISVQSAPQKKAPLRPATTPMPAAQPFDLQDVEVNEDFQKALHLIEEGNESLFITGKAGTGKSTLLRYFRGITSKTIAVIAPTGIAAVNVGGQTIHSFFGFPARLIDPKELRSGRNADVLRRLRTLVIDEISMVRADLMDGIDYALRVIRNKRNIAFGGVQVIMIGDLFQLPPVVREPEIKDYLANHYGGAYFFNAPVFTQRPFAMVELQKIYRQTDGRLVSLLNYIREGRLENAEVLEILKGRVCKFQELPNGGEEYVTLTTTNEAASRTNAAFMKRLSGPAHTFNAIVSGKFDVSSFPTDSSLLLKVGARVMMLRNDPNKRWVNGSLGIISEISPARLKVVIGGNAYEVERHTWENVKYDYNPSEDRIEPHIIGTFQQYPLRLAWAITIHKSQGHTLDRVYIDLGSGAFAHGQTYVALSRCRTLNGIALARPVFESDVIFDEAIYGYRNVFSSLEDRFDNSTKSLTFPSPSKPGSKELSSPQGDIISSENVRSIVSQAFFQKHRLSIEYKKPGFQGGQSETTQREIDVYAVGEKYLDAYCHLRQDRRIFKLERIASARILTQSYQIPKDYMSTTWVMYSEGTLDSNE